MTRSTAAKMFSSAAVAAVLVLAATPARAQYAAPPPPPQSYGPPSAQPAPPPPAEPAPGIYRSGWYFGVSVGGGGISFQDRDGNRSESLGAIMGDIYFGGMVTPQLGIQLELWGALHDYDPYEFQGYETAQLALGNAGIAAKYWATPKLWLKLGLGTASQEFQLDGETVDTVKGSSFLAGIGYELWQRGNMAIDVQFSTTMTSYEQGAADSTVSGIKFGMSWY